jgi:hypothetical protein
MVALNLYCFQGFTNTILFCRFTLFNDYITVIVSLIVLNVYNALSVFNEFRSFISNANYKKKIEILFVEKYLTALK